MGWASHRLEFAVVWGMGYDWFQGLSTYVPITLQVPRFDAFQ